jgi:VanZ family protein
MGLIFFLSSQPSLPSAPDPLSDAILKKAGHVAAYAILMLLLLRATEPRGEAQPDSSPTRKQFWVCMAILLAYAVSDEIHQSFVPGRSPRWTDVFGFDALGGLVGALAWRAYRNAR